MLAGEVRKNEDLPCSAPGFRLTVGMIQGRDLLRKVYRLSPKPPSLRCPHQAYLAGVYEHRGLLRVLGGCCVGCVISIMVSLVLDVVVVYRNEKVRSFVMSHCRNSHAKPTFRLLGLDLIDYIINFIYLIMG